MQIKVFCISLAHGIKQPVRCGRVSAVNQSGVTVAVRKNNATVNVHMNKPPQQLVLCALHSSHDALLQLVSDVFESIRDLGPFSEFLFTFGFFCSAGFCSSLPLILLGSGPGLVRVRWGGTELRVGVRLPLCDVGPDGGAAGGASSSSSFSLVVSQVGGGRVEAVFEEIKILSGLGDGEAAEGAIQLLVVHRRDGDGGVAVWLHLLPSSGHVGRLSPLSYPLRSVCRPSFSGAVAVRTVPTVSLSSRRRRESNQWPIPHRTWSVPMATLERGLGLLGELGADWLPGGRGWTGGGVVVPVSSGAAGADHFRHESTLFNLVTR